MARGIIWAGPADREYFDAAETLPWQEVKES